jgi:hypothetical protein
MGVFGASDAKAGCCPGSSRAQSLSQPNKDDYASVFLLFPANHLIANDLAKLEQDTVGLPRLPTCHRMLTSPTSDWFRDRQDKLAQPRDLPMALKAAQAY